jgi:nitroreductase
MDFLELAYLRRSIRSYTDKDVDKKDIMKLIEAAQSAPSAGNCQPWHFYVITDKHKLNELTEKTSLDKFVSSAPAVIAVCAEISRSEARYGDRGRRLYCIQDTAAAIQNILLCAANMGLGACWCGAFDENKVSGVLQLQKDVRPVAIIPVGYPGGRPYPFNRRPIEDIVTFL